MIIILFNFGILWYNVFRGDEVVKKLHSIRNFDIPVVLLTKDSNVEYDNSYKENGFDDYLLKPINKNKLNEVLNKYL